MKKVLIFACAFLFVASVVFAAPATDQGKKAPSPAQQAQQEKMKSCNAEAKTKALKGDERQKFMSDCLKGKTAAAPAAMAPAAAAQTAKQTQQEKMKLCNAEAKTKALKGAERQKFMSECLKAGK
jgi:hypothetical protein